uniref:Zinc finger protein 385D n=1 Tax=Homo sapiens TaxID=9606 RepID=A0A994J5B7_HUMAN
MRNIMYFGGTCQSPALPALVRPPAPPLQPSLDIKPFLPFPLDTAAAVNLFPNFNAGQSLPLSPRLECSGTNIIHYSLNPLVLSDPLILAFQVVGPTDGPDSESCNKPYIRGSSSPPKKANHIMQHLPVEI